MNPNQMFYTTIAAIAIAGILNWRKGEKLEDKIDAFRTEARGDIERLRMETRAAFDRLHDDMTGLHERVAKVEERTK